MMKKTREEEGEDDVVVCCPIQPHHSDKRREEEEERKGLERRRGVSSCNSEDDHDEESNSNSFNYANLTLYTFSIFALAIILRLGNASNVEQKEAGSHFNFSFSSPTCFNSCSIRIAESIPMGLSLGQPAFSTFDAWNELIENTEKELLIAAYKSSLQGKHVLKEASSSYSSEGDRLFAQLLRKGQQKNITVSMVESYPPKDKGDNEDGVILSAQGAVSRRYITPANILGRGKMHSKFLLADKRSFYLGSANLDWRSLNQKMELGVYVEDCPCLGEDLHRVYDSYWQLSYGGAQPRTDDNRALHNMSHPLEVSILGEKSTAYIAASPVVYNNLGRTHDLDAIIHAINGARKFINIHVMDYFAQFVYHKDKPYWGKIDDALRAAALRGVEIKMVTAALHYPEKIISFLRSLEALNDYSAFTSVEIKIFHVPSPSDAPIVVNRERRTHKKLLVTESTVFIGNSNWSGDYFESGTTGTAFVVQQNQGERKFVQELKKNFERDFYSEYAHALNDYFEQCILSRRASFCEGEKDPRLFA